MAYTCWDCRFFIGEAAALEQAVPGLNILSSAYGSVRWATGLCEHFDRFQVPIPACPKFQAVEAVECPPPEA
ncbi:MAG: hypothetical protein KGJ12_03515 [Gammaproteobacteria bacterium]|nr:hypothetical protein [Gammaproteobacteria bacterium]